MVKKVKYKVEDFFISDEELKNIQQVILGKNFPWYCQVGVSSPINTDGVYFTHMLFQDRITSDYASIVDPILKKLKAFCIKRIKVNMYPATSKMFEHEKHSDYPEKHKGFLFSINNNNGFTRMSDKTKIQSRENRGLFDPSDFHNSSTCTDEPYRININFNYI
mgnify:FL=1